MSTPNINGLLKEYTIVNLNEETPLAANLEGHTVSTPSPSNPILNWVKKYPVHIAFFSLVAVALGFEFTALGIGIAHHNMSLCKSASGSLLVTFVASLVIWECALKKIANRTTIA